MNPPADTLRVFIALDIPSQARESLSRALEELQSAIPSGVRWVDPSGIHLTLKFLGNIDAALVDDVLAAMRQAAQSFGRNPFNLALSQLGVFPNDRQPRVLWAGAQGDLESLARLQVLVDEAVSRLGFSPEKRPFRPHLTLGRVREGVPPRSRQSIGEAVTGIQIPPAAGWEVDTLHLIRSTLTTDGAIYTSLGRVEL